MVIMFCTPSKPSVLPPFPPILKIDSRAQKLFNLALKSILKNGFKLVLFWMKYLEIPWNILKYLDSLEIPDITDILDIYNCVSLENDLGGLLHLALRSFGWLIFSCIGLFVTFVPWGFPWWFFSLGGSFLRLPAWPTWSAWTWATWYGIDLIHVSGWDLFFCDVLGKYSRGNSVLRQAQRTCQRLDVNASNPFLFSRGIGAGIWLFRLLHKVL